MQRLVRIWNELSEGVVGAGTIMIFNRNLDRCMGRKRFDGCWQVGLARLDNLISMDKLGRHFLSLGLDEISWDIFQL